MKTISVRVYVRRFEAEQIHPHGVLKMLKRHHSYVWLGSLAQSYADWDNRKQAHTVTRTGVGAHCVICDGGRDGLIWPSPVYRWALASISTPYGCEMGVGSNHPV